MKADAGEIWPLAVAALENITRQNQWFFQIDYGKSYVQWIGLIMDFPFHFICIVLINSMPRVWLFHLSLHELKLNQRNNSFSRLRYKLKNYSNKIDNSKLSLSVNFIIPIKYE